MSHVTSKVSWMSIAVVLALLGCAGGGAGGSGGAGGGSAAARAQPQTDAEIARIMAGLQPTERLVPNADARILWQATSGYMERAFPLDELPAGVARESGASRQIRTKLVEWTGDGLPHRTRVFVEIRPDAASPANMRLRVTALMVESEPQLEQAKPGEPLQYSWRLVGGNSRIEETVADQIMRRYTALREGRPLPIDDELLVPTQKPTSG
jgi:hypothetical protein